MNTPILSISFLSSGRDEKLWRCIKSLKPLMERLPSELIIVDTGCSPQTHEKMKEIATEVVKFNWCNDFAAARNAGLSRCTGKWFMFIDDDEWVDNCEELADFFSNQQLSDCYGSAHYKVRNYKSRDLQSYDDDWNARIVRLRDGVSFKSKIHEYLSPVTGPTYLLGNTLIHHDGYLFVDEKAHRAHLDRNIGLLLDMIDDEPWESRHRVQLLQEYLGGKYYRFLKDCSESAIECFDGIDDEIVRINRGSFYIARIMALRGLADNAGAAQALCTYLQDTRITDTCRAQLCAFGASIYCESGQHEKSLDYCEQYKKYYKKYKGNDRAVFTQGIMLGEDTFGQVISSNVYFCEAVDYLYLRDLEKAHSAFEKSEAYKGETDIFESSVSAFMGAISELSYDRRLSEMVGVLLANPWTNACIIREIDSRRKNGNASDNLAEIIFHIDTDHPFIQSQKILYAEHKGKTEILPELYDSLMTYLVDLPDLDDGVLEVAINNKLDLSDGYRKIRFDIWKDNVDEITGRFDSADTKYNLIKATFTQPDIRAEYLDMKYSEAKLARIGRPDCPGSEEGETYAELRGLLCDFCDKTLEFYHRYYTEGAFTGDMEMLPVSCRFAVRMSRFLTDEEELTVSGAKERLIDCLGTGPFDEIVRKYTILYGEKMIERSTPNSVDTQMQELAKKIKESVRILIDAGLIPDAAKALEQLKSIIPNDSGVLELERELCELTGER